MKEEKKELVKNFGGMALTTALALATQGQSNIILGVLGGIATNLLSSFIEKTQYNKIKEFLIDVDPSDLNHDLKKLIVEAVDWAIENIRIEYKKYIVRSNEINELDDFTNNLLIEIRQLNDIFIDNTESLYKEIESSTHTDSLLKAFDLKANEFPIINDEFPYPNFFKEQFKPNLQLCFGELLKKESNRAALIAYQREIYQNLSLNLGKIIAQNNEILAKFDSKTYSKSKKLSINEVKKIIASTPLDELKPEFEASFKNYIYEREKDVELLLSKSNEMLHELTRVRNVTKGFSKDLKENWIEKNKVKILVSGLITIIIISLLVFYLNHLPFQMNIAIFKDNPIVKNIAYPPLSENARLRIYLPFNTIEKEVTFSNEILFNQVPSILKGEKFRIELLDPYWKTKNDSLELKVGNISVSIIPNESLACVEGRVLSRNGQSLLEGVIIRVENLSGITDAKGEFSIQIPPIQQKKKYLLRIEKMGYQIIEREYNPGSPIEIRLEP